MNTPSEKDKTPAVASDFSVNSSFVAVAHDLKNPISAIFGYTDVLLETPIGEGLNPAQRDIVIRMRDAAVRTIDLVKNYAQLSSMEVEEIKKSAFAFDLNSMIELVVHSTYREAGTGPSLSLELSSFPLLVNVERVHLDRIFTNLLSNALRYTPKDGAIKIRTESSGEHCVLEVWNRGAHIPSSEQEKIFDRSIRGKNSVGISGSGLGLYIVRTLVQALGGEIALFSSEAKNETTFKVILPLAEVVEEDLASILD